ncbi:MAG: arsenite efflux transporter metallochaperone ArsD [Caldilinea sp.]
MTTYHRFTPDAPSAMAGDQIAPLVEMFDPPMCCPTGLCGPTLDETLLTVNEMVLRLQEEGVPVARYQMTSHPQKFLSQPAVMQLVQTQQMAALPIVVVGGRIVKSGAYPTEAEVRSALASCGVQ